MAESKNKVVPEKIHIQGIKVINFSITSDDQYLDNPQKPYGLSIEMGNEIAHNLEKNAARYRLYFYFVAGDENKEPIGLKADIGIEFHFQIENLKEFIRKKEDQISIDASISATLIGIAYSTARGIVLEKTTGTFFDGIMLPVVDPNVLLKNSMNQINQEKG